MSKGNIKMFVVFVIFSFFTPIKCKTEDVIVTIDGEEKIFTTSAGYLSFNEEFTPSVEYTSSPKLQFLARQLSPSYLRLGGNSADITVYGVGKESNCRPQNNSGAHSLKEQCFFPADMERMINFTSAIKADLIFDLNEYYSYGDPGSGKNGGQRTKRPGPLNTSNMIDLLRFWKAHPSLTPPRITLGNELASNLSPETSASDFWDLRKAMDGIWPEGDAPILMGVDMWWENATWLKGFLSSKPPPLAALTWHLYSLDCVVTEERILDPTVLDRCATFADSYNTIVQSSSGYSQTPLWITETGVGWGGASLDKIAPSYLDGFWFLDQAGLLATHNVLVQHRHALACSWGPCFISGVPTLTPRPDYWSALLWKKIVGAVVLNATVEKKAPKLRVYAHCANNNSSNNFVLIVINLDLETSYNINLQGNLGNISTQEYYWLTPEASNITSSTIRLNDKVLGLGEKDGEYTLPSLAPNKKYSMNGVVVIPPRSYGFIHFPNSEVNACKKAK
eukprot:m.342629 g.342629  ORF g.342629 m.342629 type:complete len:506 (+) comp21666_c0_seq1:253-1770(+)